MENLVNFFREYWQYISIGIVVAIDIVIIFIKKRPKKYDEFVECIGHLFALVPSYIYSAEEQYPSGQGDIKKLYVLEELCHILEGRLGRDLNDTELSYFYNTFTRYIESVLETPVKKGGPGREEA